MRPFIEAGLSREWLTDPEDLSRAVVFKSDDLEAYSYLLRYHDEHGKAPSEDIFRRNYPEAAYELPGPGNTSAELIGIVREDRENYLTELLLAEAADMQRAGRAGDAVALMARASKMILRVRGANGATMAWGGKEYDIEERIKRMITRGIMTGIPGLDRQFNGFQPGNLICYLGRAKAGKTLFALLSALKAWRDGNRVLFVTFEIAAGLKPEEPGIADRLDAFSAGIDLIPYIQGGMSKEDKAKLREFDAAKPKDGRFHIVQPMSRYTVTDLEADIDRHHPDVVYLDGFYFMYDDKTGKRGSDWEAHDNLSGDLKTLGMNLGIPVIITHQVREKQLTGRKGKGIDDGAMMGGTGITMAADMVLGVDIDDDNVHTLSCTRSRLRYLTTVHGRWDWAKSEFTEVDAEPDQPDQSVFDYGKDGQSGGDQPGGIVRPAGRGNRSVAATRAGRTASAPPS